MTHQIEKTKGNSPSGKKKDSELPLIATVGTTIGGIGKATGASNSSWGNTFRDRKSFFEKAMQKDDDSTGDEDDMRRPTRSGSDRKKGSGASNSSPRKGSPQIRSTSVFSAVGDGGGGATQSNTKVMSDETGQKERMTDTFSHSQSDQDDEQEESGGEQQLKRTLDTEREADLYVFKSQERDTSTPELTSPKLQTHVLDGRNVHKDKEEVPRIRGGQTKPSPPDDADKDLLDRITLLMREKSSLDSLLAEATEENRSFQSELAVQEKSISSLQGLSNQLKKQKEVLHSKNANLSKDLSAAEKQRDELLLVEQELQGKVEISEQKLTEMEGSYRKSEQQKQSLKEELALMMKARDRLRDEKTKLDQELIDEQISKQNCLKSIRKLQDKITSLEKSLKATTQERDNAVRERKRENKTSKQAQKEVEERDTRISKLEKELTEVRSSTKRLEKEKESLSLELSQSLSSSRQLKQQVDEIKWEKQQVEQRMVGVRQNESELRLMLDQVVAEVDNYGKQVQEKMPGVRYELQPPKISSQSQMVSPDMMAHLKSVKSVQSTVLKGLNGIVHHNHTLEENSSRLQSQVKSLQTDVEKLEKQLHESKRETERARKRFAMETEKLTDANDNKILVLKEDIERLGKANSSLQDQNVKLTSDITKVKLQQAQQLGAIQSKLSVAEASVSLYQSQTGRLLAEMACTKASLQLVEAEGKGETTDDGNMSPAHTRLYKQEKERLSEELKDLNAKHLSVIVALEGREEELREQKLETNKMKMQLTTDKSLLKSQIAQLEKEKDELESSGSAFQPFQPATKGQSNRKVMFDPIQEKTQQELLELRHKLTIMETENKRLQELAHSSTTLDAGNALRRHTLEMRRRCVFLESEKKQLTERVHNLHTSLKALRESKDRMISERLRILQSENISLQDNIRTSETIFNKKLMDAASKMAETLKENDKLRHTLGHLQNGLSSIDSLLSGLNHLCSHIQIQEQELATLRASLAGSSSNLIPAMEISERILKTHGEIQALLASRVPEEAATRSSSLNRPVSSGQSALPPVLQQFSPEYISSLQGSSSAEKMTASGRARSHSQSQSSSSSVPNFILQLREKLSQLLADNLSICDLVKHGQENLDRRQNDVSLLREKLLTLQSNVHAVIKAMQESHYQLCALNQQSLSLEQITSIEYLEHEVENWQDKVLACEMALKDIETRMQEDYESHNRRFSVLMSQILDLKEEVSSKRDKLLAKDQYIHDIEERCLNAENELSKLRKEMECVMQEALNVPEGFQLSSHGGNVSELIRSQNEDLVHLRSVLNASTFQQNRLQAKLESLHRENTVLKHQGLETERHHSKILEELYTERDYLRNMHSQLIGRQLKPDEAGEMLKKLKRTQEMEKEQMDFKRLSHELENVKFATREKDMIIAELQHQLENQQVELLKLLQSQTTSAAEVMMGTGHQPKLGPLPQGRSTRPHSANSADSARQSRYIIANLDHPKVVNRNPFALTAAGDFFIRIPASTTGESILNLDDSSGKSSDGRYMIGFPVVTDDEGASTTSETVVPSKHQKGRIRRHRRTASEGSDSLKNLMSSGSSASDSQPFNQSSTLPRQQLQQKEVKRPGSVDSMCYEIQSPVDTPTPTEKHEVRGDVVGHYAQKFSEQIGEMIHQHDQSDDTMPTKLESSNPVKVERVPGEKSGKSDRFSAKLKGIRSVLGGRQYCGSKGSLAEKGKAYSKNSESVGIYGLYTSGSMQETNKSDEASSSTGSSNQVSRMTSFASTVDRSDSFASTVSTTFSGLGGESSPSSNISLESFRINDSMDNLMLWREKSCHPFFTPINNPSYTSSSDDESRYAANGENRTLRRTLQKDTPLPSFMSGHHRTTSSCDSDQLLSDAVRSRSIGVLSVPLHRDESISISDMDKELTDQEEVQEKIHRLEKRFEKVRRSSTGSITICNHSGSSMEDIKAAGE